MANWTRDCLYCRKTTNRSKYCSKKCGEKYRYAMKEEENKKRSREYYEANKDNPEFKEKRKIRHKRWREKNKEKIKEYSQKSYSKDKFKWKIRRKSQEYKEKFKKLKGNKCEKCGSHKNLQIHHKFYDLNSENWKLLCIDCHKKRHK